MTTVNQEKINQLFQPLNHIDQNDDEVVLETLLKIFRTISELSWSNLEMFLAFQYWKIKLLDYDNELNQRISMFNAFAELVDDISSTLFIRLNANEKSYLIDELGLETKEREDA